MKKLLGTLITASAFVAVSSLATVRAEGATETEQDPFTKVQTMASLKVAYNIDTKFANDVDLRFGATIDALEEGAKYGVLVLDSTEVTPEKLAAIKTSTDLEKYKDHTVEITPELNKDGKYQFSWVITNVEGHFDQVFNASVYKVKGDVVTLGQPKEHSVNTILDAYKTSDKVTGDNKVVVENIISEMRDVTYTISEDTLKSYFGNGTTFSNIFAYYWDESAPGKFTDKLVPEVTDSGNVYKITLKSKYRNIKFITRNAETPDWGNGTVESQNLVITNDGIQNEIVIKDSTPKPEGHWMNNHGNNKWENGKEYESYIYAWGGIYGDGKFMKVDSQNGVTLNTSTTGFKFVYFDKTNSNHGWNEVIQESNFNLNYRMDNHGNPMIIK